MNCFRLGISRTEIPTIHVTTGSEVQALKKIECKKECINLQ